jgi:signal peptidase I
MEPTIAIGQNIQVDTTAYRTSAGVRRGDVVVFRPPGEADKVFVKRLVGLPGERVTVVGGRVFINGRAFTLTPGGDASLEDAGSSTYRVKLDSRCGGTADLTLPPEAFFALGDNRCASYDSRDFGAVPFASLEGRVLLRDH